MRGEESVVMWLAAQIPGIPEQASSNAWKIDALYGVLVLLTFIFSVGVFVAVVWLAIRYRVGSKVDRSGGDTHSPAGMVLEVTWTVIPLILALAVFGWSAVLYYEQTTPPPNATDMYVTGRQWMWKIQHPDGRREINELHIPVGQPVKLIMTSQDVIHSFYVPEFRIKQDVLPGAYTTMWFEPTKAGTYRIYCAEYCGTDHSRMIGYVYVMEPADYEEWLRTGNPQESMLKEGERLFREKGCSGCHGGNASVRAPLLNGIYNSQVPLQGPTPNSIGEVVIADDMYLHDSIVQPRKQIVGGYEPIMPTYEGQLTSEELLQLVAYIKSLK
jgi:cytochrome c oxidase subunit II